jgi:hypothetical protein
LSREEQAAGLMVHKFKVFVENGFPEEMDILERTGVYENFPKNAQMILEHTDELIGRASVEITLQLDMKTFAFPSKKNLKIAGRRTPPSDFNAKILQRDMTRLEVELTRSVKFPLALLNPCFAGSAMGGI